ncbi:MAG: CHAT domain-containing protein [Burkholderiaceae bacterium]|nr:CHAT domain-containing protein [Burkholderiaceae bacterium]
MSLRQPWRLWRAGLLLWAISVLGPGPALAQPDAAQTLALARQQQAAGQAPLAIWLARQALLQTPAQAPQAAGIAAELAGWLAQQGRLDEARLLLDRARAHALAGFVGSGQHPAVALPDWRDEAADAAWSGAWAQAWSQTGDAQAALQALAQLPQPRRLPQPPRVQAGSGELQLHLIASEHGLALLLDGGGQVQVQQLDWPLAERELELARLAQALQDGSGQALPLLQRLYQRLGRPADQRARDIGARRLVLHAQGSLRELPWAALHDGQAYLGERYAVSHGHGNRGGGPASAGIAAQARLYALGVSQSRAGQPALPGVARELCHIVAGPVHGLQRVPHNCGQGQWRGEAWLDQQFDGARLQQAVAEGRAQGQALLHLGTHFDLRPGRMALSTLLLGDGSRWPLARLAELDFRGHALVTLAACDTGAAGGEAADSLQSLILNRGARAVLASLWQVDDASTSALMRSFYSHLGRHGPAEALRLAQSEVRRQPGWQHPQHWAGFVLAMPS